MYNVCAYRNRSFFFFFGNYSVRDDPVAQVCIGIGMVNHTWARYLIVHILPIASGRARGRGLSAAFWQHCDSRGCFYLMEQDGEMGRIIGPTCEDDDDGKCSAMIVDDGYGKPNQ